MILEVHALQCIHIALRQSALLFNSCKKLLTVCFVIVVLHDDNHLPSSVVEVRDYAGSFLC